MEAAELKRAINQVLADPSQIGITVYAVLKQGSLAKLDVEQDAKKELLAMFSDSIRNTIVDKEGLELIKLSVCDERKNAIYLYDLPEPPSLACLKAIKNSDDIPIYVERLGHIDALLIEIGNNEEQIVLFQNIAAVNIFGKKQYFLIRSQSRLKRITEEFLRILSTFQVLKIGDSIVVVNLEAIERMFGFADIIQREAQKGVKAIAEKGLVENTDTLKELIKDIKYARKFTKIAKSSPVITAQVPNQKIVEFCNSYPSLKGRIRFNSSSDKIVLDTQVSKDLLIKLLMDDFLTSKLTNFHYESLAKDSVESTKVEAPGAASE